MTWDFPDCAIDASPEEHFNATRGWFGDEHAAPMRARPNTNQNPNLVAIKYPGHERPIHPFRDVRSKEFGNALREGAKSQGDTVTVYLRVDPRKKQYRDILKAIRRRLGRHLRLETSNRKTLVTQVCGEERWLATLWGMDGTRAGPLFKITATRFLPVLAMGVGIGALYGLGLGVKA